MVVGGFTVRAVVFTVVEGCPGVCHYQQLLDVTLEEVKKENKSRLSAETTKYFTVMNWEVKRFLLSSLFVNITSLLDN